MRTSMLYDKCFGFLFRHLLYCFCFCVGLTCLHFLHRPCKQNPLWLQNSLWLPNPLWQTCMLWCSTALQWRMHAMHTVALGSSAFQWDDRLKIRRPNKLGPKEKGLKTGETGSTDKAVQDGHVGWQLQQDAKAAIFPLSTVIFAKPVCFYKFYSITFNSFAQRSTCTRGRYSL